MSRFNEYLEMASNEQEEYDEGVISDVRVAIRDKLNKIADKLEFRGAQGGKIAPFTAVISGIIAAVGTGLTPHYIGSQLGPQNIPLLGPIACFFGGLGLILSSSEYFRTEMIPSFFRFLARGITTVKDVDDVIKLMEDSKEKVPSNLKGGFTKLINEIKKEVKDGDSKGLNYRIAESIRKINSLKESNKSKKNNE